jgi:hypothetical protein
MKHFSLLVFSLLVYVTLSAQSSANNKLAVDSVAKKDSLVIEDLKDNELDNIPTISLDDNALSDNSSQNVSSPLTAGRDPFYAASYYNFSPLRFKSRGYDANFSGAYINGIPMDNLDNGFTPYGLWSGLNDVLRNRSVSIGLGNNNFSFGDVGNTVNIDTRASKQRAQTSISYGLSDRNYTDKFSITHSTGLSKKGWAFTFSGSRRWSSEGYVPGTYFNGWSYFAGVDKKLGKNNLLSLVAFGAPTEDGLAGASTMEMMNLAGSHYYNPDWGYQNGQKRNADVAKTNEPVFILTHELHINKKTTLVTAAGYSFGTKSTSGLDWYNAPDPRPDYYGYLPSNYADDPYQQQQLQQLFSNNENTRQIDWQELYNINRNNIATINDVNGIAGNAVTGIRSLYILSDRVTDTKRFNANTTLNTTFGKVRFTAGVSYQSQKNNYYEKVDDLLGGEFYVDLNQFAQRDYPNNPGAYQNNINDPNRILHVGDKYGYDYDIDINKLQGWAQAAFSLHKFDFFVAGQLSQTQFWRVGNVANGLFPDNSFGKSAVNNFTNYGAKAGITYKIDSKNYFYANAGYTTRAPYFQDVYESPSTRDVEQSGLTSEIAESVEGGYVMNTPFLKLRISGYYTKFTNGFDVVSFYDDQYSNYVNYALSNIDKLHFGGELGFEAKILPGVSLNGAAAVGRYYYTSRQNAVVTLDNDASILDKEVVYSNNYRVPSTPQEAYSLGITYRSRKYWFVSLTGNYFDQMWLAINPIRRTIEAVQGLDPKSAQYADIVGQTELPAQYTLDFYGGYSWKLPKSLGIKRNTFLVVDAGVTNLLNNQNIINGGYEQLRFDFTNQTPSTFPAKYYYAYGINYYISAMLRF